MDDMSDAMNAMVSAHRNDMRAMMSTGGMNRNAMAASAHSKDMRGLMSAEVMDMKGLDVRRGHRHEGPDVRRGHRHDDRQDMTALEDAPAAVFQMMWLEMMIEHHTGAIDMSKAETDGGQYKPAIDLATNIADSQTAEIETMQSLLGS